MAKIGSELKRSFACWGREVKSHMPLSQNRVAFAWFSKKKRPLFLWEIDGWQWTTHLALISVGCHMTEKYVTSIYDDVCACITDNRSHFQLIWTYSWTSHKDLLHIGQRFETVSNEHLSEIWKLKVDLNGILLNFKYVFVTMSLDCVCIYGYWEENSTVVHCH